jgi:hypothetical protein
MYELRALARWFQCSYFFCLGRQSLVRYLSCLLLEHQHHLFLSGSARVVFGAILSGPEKKMLKTRCSAKTLNSFHKSKFSAEQYFFNPDPCESSKRLQNQDGYVLFWFQSTRLASIVPTMLMKSMFRLHISGKGDLHRLRRFFLRFIDRFK